MCISRNTRSSARIQRPGEQPELAWESLSKVGSELAFATSCPSHRRRRCGTQQRRASTHCSWPRRSRCDGWEPSAELGAGARPARDHFGRAHAPTERRPGRTHAEGAQFACNDSHRSAERDTGRRHRYHALSRSASKALLLSRSTHCGAQRSTSAPPLLIDIARRRPVHCQIDMRTWGAALCTRRHCCSGRSGQHSSPTSRLASSPRSCSRFNLSFAL
jgi:hypothetical protein